jgi:hypothetical protein
MFDGPREAIRGSHRDAKGDPDSEHAAAASDPRGAGSRVRQTDEIIVGWRVWSLSSISSFHLLHDKAGPLVLSSTFMISKWPPGQAMAACCGTNVLRHGVHAFLTREQTLEYTSALKPGRYVFGEVSLWGRVIIHEHGYRAAYAYPKRIFVPEKFQGGRDLVNELRRSYGVEVEWTA